MLRKLIFWAVLFLAGWGYGKYQHAQDCAAAGGQVTRGLCRGETQ
ncbi:hypothetical protein ACEWPM_008330 [Roseovarius sp. S4756]